MARLSFTLAGSALTMALVLPALALAAPPAAKGKDAPTPRACPSDKVWNESQGGCVCGPGTAWDTPTRKCVAEGTKVEPRRVPADERKTKNQEPKAVPEPKVAAPVPAPAAPPAPPPPPADEPQRNPTDEPRSDEAMANEARAEREARDREARAARNQRTCAPGTRPSSDGQCPRPAACPAGTHRLGTGLCVRDAKSCPEGREWKDAWAACVPACPPGQVLDFKGDACHTIKRIGPR